LFLDLQEVSRREGRFEPGHRARRAQRRGAGRAGAQRSRPQPDDRPGLPPRERPAPKFEDNLDPGPFERREDDTEGAVRRQLEAHRREFAFLKERYEGRGLLSVVDAGRAIEEVADDVLEALGCPERPEYYALGKG
jgi:adenylate kinase family enzyme